MGRTLPSITQEFLMEQEAFTRFRRALRRSDQIALDDLFVSAQKHLAAAAYAAHALPLETFMLSMLLEEHKEVQRLRRQMDEITGQLPAGEERMLLDEETESEAAPRQARGSGTALDRLGQRRTPVEPACPESVEIPLAELACTERVEAPLAEPACAESVEAAPRPLRKNSAGQLQARGSDDAQKAIGVDPDPS